MNEAVEANVDKGTVLVVDDDPDMLLLLTKWLSGAGFTVISAESGSSALGHLQGSHPDLVVTDLFMEEMDGMTLVKRIHASSSRRWLGAAKGDRSRPGTRLANCQTRMGGGRTAPVVAALCRVRRDPTKFQGKRSLNCALQRGGPAAAATGGRDA